MSKLKNKITEYFEKDDETFIEEETRTETSKKSQVILLIGGIAGILILTGTILFLTISFSIRNERKHETMADSLTDAFVGGNLDQLEAHGEYVMQEDEKESRFLYSGTIGCALLIPKIDIQRVVIEGGDQDYNLEQFLFTSASDSMHYDPYSEKNYCIWGHQSYVWGFSMNRLDELIIGDYFYLLTADGYKHEYEIYDISTSQWEFTDNDLTGTGGTVSIYTCTKQKQEPKPYYVVRGKKTGNVTSVVTDTTENEE